MKFFLASLIIIACLSTCQKQDATPTPVPAPAPVIDFGPNGGITQRDAIGYPQGDPDPTDWTLDDSWNQQEQDLFKELGFNLNTMAISGVKASRVFAWPNPVGVGQVRVNFESNNPVALSFVVVDAKYRAVLPLQTSPNLSPYRQYLLDVSGSTFQQGKLYRLYYVLYDGKVLHYKGHGDIKIGL
ncbi:hypothetical protein [Hymenobacter psychrophilus]|uniref:Beta-lactamase-inhibitor-like, PepSY-like n=1 Tax=Hymenobacter psychrophilus TaxID=651662 RepID=A0A1H3KKX0_9BACT|nr:hypothetical protein [Hymenobacter psychrophilus]SDY52726.1 hypothetical protein SAMN04488069_109173 [Hymenobacter psychrophilus]